MSILFFLLAPAISFVCLCLLFWPLESTFPAKHGQRFFRPDWLTDFYFFLGQYWVWLGVVFSLIDYFEDDINFIIPATFRHQVSLQPWWLQVLEVVVLSDFLVYWGHRLQHNVGFLWRFHSIHHTSEHLDWLAAHREHPVDTLYTITLVNLPAIILGFPLQTIAALIVFRGIWAIFIHSNINIPLGPLGILIGSPRLHHWHHAKDRLTGNYANISPLMDYIFGTHIYRDTEPESFGIDEPTTQSYMGLLVQPFVKR